VPAPESRDLCFTPAAELVRLYRARKVSPLEVMQAVLARIDAVNPAVNAYVTVARETALASARAATRALGRKHKALPPLHGVPVSIKDLTPTKGIRTTWGSAIYRDHVPEEDDLVVQRFKAAGAIIVGKTNTPEFGAGGTTFNALFGATRNPWNTALTSGGSSGGAAVAIATGMGPIGQGTDLGGSLRVPAAFCGVIGFRTTPGLIPRYPRTLAWDSLSVTGPMARTVADVALTLSAIAGPDERVPLSYKVDTSEFTRAVRTPVIKGWRVAWTPDLGGLIPVDEEVASVAHDALKVLRALGARVESACPDFSATSEIVAGTRGLAMLALHADKVVKWRERMQKDLVRDIEEARALSAADIARAEVLRSALWQRVQAFMAGRELLVLPTVAVPPFPVEQPYPPQINGKPVQSYTHWLYLTYGISVTGLPAISVPCGFTRAGLPVGLQLVGRRCQDAAVLRAAAAFEAAAPWTDSIPPVVSVLTGEKAARSSRFTPSRARKQRHEASVRQ
jgi:amidase